MASFPLQYPQNVNVSPFGPSGFHVLWTGDACVYKLAYKLENALIWNVLAMSGPTFTSGSGYFTDDTPLVSPGAGGLLASFGVDGLAFGVYDLRLINIAPDGSDYVLKTKYMVEQNVGFIPNLKLLATTNGNNILQVGWDDPTIDSGAPFILSWCRLSDEGKKTDCESIQVPNLSRSAEIPFHEEEKMVVFVSQVHSSGQSAVSSPLNVKVCPCGNAPVGGGTSTPATAQQFVVGERLTGNQDGVNEIFLSALNMKALTERILINGVVQDRGTHYNIENGNEVHFAIAPLGIEILTADYEVDQSTT